MAFWHRRGTRVFVYYSQEGKQVVLPRGLTAELDSEPDHNVEAWVRDWELRNGRGGELKAPVEIPAKFRRWIDEYVADYRLDGRRSSKTAADHERMLHGYVIPYFVVEHGGADPNDWVRHASRFAAWVRAKTESEHQLARANAALVSFWEWMGEERHVLAGLGIKLKPSRVRPAQTPLKRVVLPEEVLAYVRRGDTKEDLRIMALLGYFCSLRPQEIFALRRRHFVGGSEAAGLQACQVISQHHLLLAPEKKLYGRLAVQVEAQLTQEGEETPPKAYSHGWVACFDAQAAQLLVELMNRIEEPEARLLGYLPDRHLKRWRKLGLGVTLKDLRRASGYWLGHYTSMDRSKLRSHMRHKDEETTQKYMRRPGELPGGGFKRLDLDA